MNYNCEVFYVFLLNLYKKKFESITATQAKKLLAHHSEFLIFSHSFPTAICNTLSLIKLLC